MISKPMEDEKHINLQCVFQSGYSVNLSSRVELKP